MESSSFTANRRAEFVYGISAALQVPARNVVINKIMVNYMSTITDLCSKEYLFSKIHKY